MEKQKQNVNRGWLVGSTVERERKEEKKKILKNKNSERKNTEFRREKRKKQSPGHERDKNEGRRGKDPLRSSSIRAVIEKKKLIIISPLLGFFLIIIINFSLLPWSLNSSISPSSPPFTFHVVDKFFDILLFI